MSILSSSFPLHGLLTPLDFLRDLDGFLYKLQVGSSRLGLYRLVRQFAERKVWYLGRPMRSCQTAVQNTFDGPAPMFGRMVWTWSSKRLLVLDGSRIHRTVTTNRPGA